MAKRGHIFLHISKSAKPRGHFQTALSHLMCQKALNHILLVSLTLCTRTCQWRYTAKVLPERVGNEVPRCFSGVGLKLLRTRSRISCSAQSQSPPATTLSDIPASLRARQCWKGYRFSCIIDSLHFIFKWAFLNIQIKLHSASLRNFERLRIKETRYLSKLQLHNEN